MSSPRKTTNDLGAVADALRSHDRFLLVTHENPDGDALGSLLAMKLALDSLGKDSEMYLYGDAPLPREYAFMPLEGLLREPPEDAAERVLVALDCANEQRMGPDTTLLEQAPLSIDIVSEYLLPVLDADKRAVFVVVDCLRLDQWRVLEPILAPLFDIETTHYYSVLPTATNVPATTRPANGSTLERSGTSTPRPVSNARTARSRRTSAMAPLVKAGRFTPNAGRTK